jgi:N-hydroxyarylamine O-acetyltransferase
LHRQVVSVDPDRYLGRIGLSPTDIDGTDFRALETLQRAHVRNVPFENLAITGDPSGTGRDAGVTLGIEGLYRKIVERERGGFCYELNGLFGWLLEALGFETERIAARVLDEAGNASPPANHHANVVTLDGRYLVDVGVAIPTVRRPLPLDGRVREDEVGVAWRVVESDRPDADYCTQFREPGEDWQNRYVFRDRTVDLGFFRATCEFLATAPESPFTGDPFVTIATGSGHLKLERDRLTVREGGREREEPIDPREWNAVLEREFGIPRGEA